MNFMDCLDSIMSPPSLAVWIEIVNVAGTTNDVNVTAFAGGVD